MGWLELSKFGNLEKDIYLINLENLEVLQLSNNKLKIFPADIQRLKSLKMVELSYNSALGALNRGFRKKGSLLEKIG